MSNVNFDAKIAASNNINAAVRAVRSAERLWMAACDSGDKVRIAVAQDDLDAALSQLEAVISRELDAAYARGVMDQAERMSG